MNTVDFCCNRVDYCCRRVDKEIQKNKTRIKIVKIMYGTLAIYTIAYIIISVMA